MGTIVAPHTVLTNAAVHPHGRGDNVQETIQPLLRFGSPPRAWGQSRSAARRSADARFTPTGVGTMYAAFSAAPGATVHPHGRGDNSCGSNSGSASFGSPPRAWGQSAPPSPLHRPGRFTPTGVGTIRSASRLVSTRAVHPHGRGDNLNDNLEVVPKHGSPPRAWGQFGAAQRRIGTVRFTPTGVGTMRHIRNPSYRATVHPHGRGDNVHIGPRAASGRGSPPRAWGQFAASKAFQWYRRFTPTGVGTIRNEGSGILDRAVHPHGRGDNV